MKTRDSKSYCDPNACQANHFLVKATRVVGCTTESNSLCFGQSPVTEVRRGRL